MTLLRRIKTSTTELINVINDYCAIAMLRHSDIRIEFELGRDQPNPLLGLPGGDPTVSKAATACQIVLGVSSYLGVTLKVHARDQNLKGGNRTLLCRLQKAHH